MSTNHDIKMFLDDTLELDYIIKDIDPNNSISINPKDNLDSNSYNLSGLETRTGVFDPDKSGEYDISINGQILTVKVIDSNGFTKPVDNPILWYPMDEGEGSTLKDNIGTVGDATIAGQSGWTRGDFMSGSAVKMKESSDSSNAIELPDENGQYPANDFTIALTVEFLDGQNQINMVDINASGSSVEQRDAGIYLGAYVSSDEIEIGLEADYRETYTRSDGLSTNKKYRILVVRDGGNVKVFVNGSSIGSKSLYSGTISYYAEDYEDNSVHIGSSARAGAESYTRKAIYDDFILYDKVMNDAQIDYNRQPWS